MSLDAVLAEVQNSYVFEKEVTIKGIKYVLRVLDSESERKVNEVVKSEDVSDDVEEYMKVIRSELLSRAIVSIKDQPVPDVVEVKDKGEDGEEKTKKIDKAIYLKGFLKGLPGTVLSSLFDAYIDAREEQEEAISKEMRYDWFKTPEQREEERKKELEKSEEEEKEPEDTDKADEEVEDVKLTPVNETKEPNMPLEKPDQQ